jgi:F-type H+-transporting ATPase subunit delta
LLPANFEGSPDEFNYKNPNESASIISKEVEELAEIFEAYPDFKNLLTMPTIPLHTRKDIVYKVFIGKINNKLLNFLLVLLDNGRMVRWESIVRTFQKLVSASENITDGDVVTAVPIDDERKGHIEEVVGKLVGKNVRLSNEIDPGIIGGVKVMIDGKIIDGSIKAALEDMREIVNM